MMQIVPVPQLADNYAYLLTDSTSRAAAVVDCAEAEPVLRVVEEMGVELRAILPTHHHWDHVGGHADLLRTRALAVYGYAGQAERIPGCTTEVHDGEPIRIGALQARVVFIPAHTSGHVAYYFEREQAVFTGDTLFIGGCGRLFEGDAALMMQSLQKLMKLPDETRVYCGHEYTEKNLRFALTLEPTNTALRQKYDWAVQQIRKGLPTVPSTIASEKATNPFLRWTSPELRASVRRQFPGASEDDVAVFARVRALKDRF